jgi:hypothetical protein
MMVLAASAAAKPQTTAPPPAVVVKVTITDSGISMSPKHAARGAVARFVVVNRGSRPHTFAIEPTAPQGGFRRLLAPREQKILLLFLDYRGRIAYSAPQPADRAKPGMRGFFTIT